MSIGDVKYAPAGWYPDGTPRPWGKVTIIGIRGEWVNIEYTVKDRQCISTCPAYILADQPVNR